MKQQAKHKLKMLLGTTAEKLIPQLAREVDTGASTGKHVRLKNWIVYSRLARAQEGGDTSSMSSAHFDYWKSDTSNAFYDQYTFRYEQWFLKHHAVLVDKVAEACGESGAYRRFLEIGCGDGRVTQYCQGKIAGLEEVVGLDINPTIISRNAKSPSLDSKIEWVHGHATEWLTAHPRSGTILFSYGGVLEYFAEEKLLELLATLGAHAPALIGLVEPIDPHHDLESVKKSYPFGAENSFSHNHRVLLEKSGYTVRFDQEMLVGGVRWTVMLGEKKAV